MELTGSYVAGLYEKLKKKRPIIHCITNAVTVNDCANILLAAGASPTMAHHPEEAAEITSGTAALVCNFGAIDDYEAMIRAGERAAESGHAVVVDPVGVSGSTFRRKKCREFIDGIKPSCIRGNYSEIRALADNCSTMTGVDAVETGITPGFVREVISYAEEISAVVAASGPSDIITDGHTLYICDNGDPLMARITGSGCMSSVMLGAFLSVENSAESAAACCAFMGTAGEIAAENTAKKHGGTMTFRNELIDAVSLMKGEEIEKKVRIRASDLQY